METQNNEEQFEGWAVLELMGHRRLAGYVRAVNFAGAALIRIDVPSVDPQKPAATQFYSPSALYALTPTTEDLARRFAVTNQPTPVHRWELPAQSSRPGATTVSHQMVVEDVDDNQPDGE